MIKSALNRQADDPDLVGDFSRVSATFCNPDNSSCMMSYYTALAVRPLFETYSIFDLLGSFPLAANERWFYLVVRIKPMSGVLFYTGCTMYF